MAVVYRAHQLALGRDVALKVMLPDLQIEEVSRKRFRRECLAMGKLQGQHSIRILDTGDDGGMLYYAMELIEAPTLYSVLEGPSPRKHVDPARALLIGAELCDGLAVVHGAGMIHRDIKPGNIFLHPERGAVLGDFGLVKSLGQATKLTEEGATIGTVNYMSPEQCYGAAVGPGTDIYAVGLVVFEMIALRRPFLDLDVAAQMGAHAMREPPDLRGLVPDLPAEVGEVVMRALAKKPEERPPSALAFRDQLRRTHARAYEAPAPGGASGRTTRKRLTASKPVAVRTTGRGRLAAGLVGVALAAVLGRFTLGGRADPPAEHVAVTPSLHRAQVKFDTARASMPTVEYWSAGETPRTTAALAPALAHDLSLAALREGTDYSLRILTGSRASPVMRFRTDDVGFHGLDVVRGLDRATLSFQTALPVRAVANWWAAGQAARSQSRAAEGSPTTTHSVVLDQLDPDRAYSAQLGFLTADLESSKSPEIEIPGALAMLNQLAARIKSLQIERTIRVAQSLLLRNVVPRPDRAERVRQALAGRVNELAGMGRALSPLAARFFASRDVYLKEKVNLYWFLVQAAHLDRFLAQEDIGLSTGLDQVDRGPFRTSTKEELGEIDVVELPLEKPQGWAALGDAGLEADMMGKRQRQDCTVRVTNVAKVSRAELVLHVAEHSPALYFEVSINGQARLAIPGRLGPPPPVNLEVPYYHQFPTDLLVEGDNSVTITLHHTPGLLSLATPFLATARLHLVRTR